MSKLNIKPSALLISSDRKALKCIRQVLLEIGITVHVAHTVDSAEQRLNSGKTCFSILDLSLENGVGVQLINSIVETNRRTYLILTSDGDEIVMNAAARVAEDLGLNVVATLSKPINPEAIKTAISKAAENRQDLTHESLANALTRQEIVFHYQPLVRLENSCVVGCEALARWQHPKLGLLQPSRFIEMVEIPFFARDFVEYTISTIARDKEFWQTSSDAVVAINMPPSVLANKKSADWLAEIVLKNKLAPQQVIIEITERVSTKVADNLAINVTQLRLAGFGVALDDFGTGNSSLIRLYRIPFSELKIDQLFVMGSAKNNDARQICNLLGQGGLMLKRRTIAEGIENEESLNLMKEAGCILGQGYYWSKPLEPQNYQEWCLKQNARLGCSGVNSA